MLANLIPGEGSLPGSQVAGREILSLTALLIKILIIPFVRAPLL